MVINKAFRIHYAVGGEIRPCVLVVESNAERAINAVFAMVAGDSELRTQEVRVYGIEEITSGYIEENQAALRAARDTAVGLQKGD